MRIKPVIFIIFGGAYLLPTPTMATSCNLHTLSSPEPVAVLFEPFEQTTAIGSSVIEFRNDSETDLYELRFHTETEALSMAGFDIKLEPSETGGPLGRIDEDRLSLHLPGGETAKLTFNIIIFQQGLPPPGVISTEFKLDVINAATGDVCKQTLTLPVKVMTTSRAQLNIAGAAGAYTDGPDLYRLDFGSLKTGMSRQVFLQIRANGDASLSFQSKNKGRLAHTEMPENTIPYRFQVSGESVDLGSISSILVPPARSFRGISLPVVITLGEVNGPPGEYEDIVTITVSAL